MIQRITTEQYLKRYNNMTGQEKLSVMNRVGAWLKDCAPLLLKAAEQPEAHLQGVMMISQGWNDLVSKDWMEGVKLMTAFAGMTDTWLPDRLYIKAARRSIRQMVDVLREFYKPNMSNRDEHNEHSGHNEPIIEPTMRKRGRPRKTEQQPQTPQDTQTTHAPKANNVAPGEDKYAVNNNVELAKTVIPRPQHIDQYAYLLPEETQKRAAQYGQLMRDLGTSRENMRLLMNDPQSNAMEREKWAKVAVKIDGQIAAIRSELDREWKKVVETGRVVVDELGMAHIIDPATGKIADPEPKVKLKEEEKQKPKAEVDKPKRVHHKQLTDEEKAKRISYLQKWLRDPRPVNSDEHRKQWEQNVRELIRLGGNVTDSIVKAGEHYGAKIPRKRE